MNSCSLADLTGDSMGCKQSMGEDLSYLSCWEPDWIMCGIHSIIQSISETQGFVPWHHSLELQVLLSMSTGHHFCVQLS